MLDFGLHASDSIDAKSTQATCCRRKHFFQSTRSALLSAECLAGRSALPEERAALPEDCSASVAAMLTAGCSAAPAILTEASCVAHWQKRAAIAGISEPYGAIEL